MLQFYDAYIFFFRNSLATCSFLQENSARHSSQKTELKYRMSLEVGRTLPANH